MPGGITSWNLHWKTKSGLAKAAPILFAFSYRLGFEEVERSRMKAETHILIHFKVLLTSRTAPGRY
jgi:hypothetical protein